MHIKSAFEVPQEAGSLEYQKSDHLHAWNWTSVRVSRVAPELTIRFVNCNTLLRNLKTDGIRIRVTNTPQTNRS